MKLNKIILVTDIPDDCYEITVQVKCECFSKTQIHVLGYELDEVNQKIEDYKKIEKQLKELGIE